MAKCFTQRQEDMVKNALQTTKPGQSHVNKLWFFLFSVLKINLAAENQVE